MVSSRLLTRDAHPSKHEIVSWGYVHLRVSHGHWVDHEAGLGLIASTEGQSAGSAVFLCAMMCYVYLCVCMFVYVYFNADLFMFVRAI